LEDCYLDAYEPVCLDYATASLVRLTGCRLAGLTGDLLTAAELDLHDSTLTCPLWLRGASINRQLICRGSSLTVADRTGNALLAERIETRGDVILDDGFRQTGPSCWPARTSAGSSAAGTPP
jgi:hypothetical protein